MARREDLVEALAALEHEQWMDWARAVMPEVTAGRRQRWHGYMVPYEELEEPVKELDRAWARRALAVLERHGVRLEGG